MESIPEEINKNEEIDIKEEKKKNDENNLFINKINEIQLENSDNDDEK